MKFILEESKKFILSETFILNEADDTGIEVANLLSDDEIYVDSAADTPADWETEYSSATDKNMVWEAYLKAEWKAKLSDTDFKRVNSIQKALRAECEEYGFDDTNPFFHYIKNVYLKNSSMTAAAYNAVHNAVADAELKIDDILGKGILKDKNLVFCQHLLIQKENIVTLYLRRQAALIKKEVPTVVEKVDPANSKHKDLPTDIPEKFNSSADFVTYVLYENKESGKLRPLKVINALELFLTKAVSGRTGADSIDVDAPAVIQNIEKESDLIELAAALSLNFRLSDSKNNTKLAQRIQELNKTPWENVTKLIGTVLNKTHLTLISKEQAKDLIAAINKQLN